MKNCAFYFLCLLFLAGWSSCDTKRIYEENKDIPDHLWSNNNILSFTVDIQDTLSYHNVYINLRNKGDYAYSNIYLFLNTSYPDGKTSRDTIECILADNTGRWLGKGSGDVWDNQVLFKRAVRFKQAGIYKFTYEQAMRVESLAGIMAAGLRIEKQ